MIIEQLRDLGLPVTFGKPSTTVRLPVTVSRCDARSIALL